YVDEWRNNPEQGTLSSVIREDGSLMIIDTRSDATFGQVTLSSTERIAYEFCDEVHSLSSITGHLRELQAGVSITEAAVKDFMDSLVANRLAITDGRHYLSLAIPVEPVRRLANCIAPTAAAI